MAVVKDIAKAVDENVDVKGLFSDFFDILDNYLEGFVEKTENPWDDSALAIARPMAKQLLGTAALSVESFLKEHADSEEEK